MKLSNKYYDRIKWGVLYFLPGFTTLVLTLGNLYQWAHTDIAVGTLTAVTTFLGAILGISSLKYNEKTL